MIKLFLKFIITIMSFFPLMLTIAFSADTGTGLEIAGKIIVALFLFALFQYAVWHSEINSVLIGTSTKRWLIGVIIIFLVLFFLLGFFQF